MSASEGSDEEGSDGSESGEDEIDDAMTLDQVQLGLRREALVRKNTQTQVAPHKKGRVEKSGYKA